MEYMESRMQDKMDSAMAEHDHLCEKLDPPGDWSNPDWSLVGTCNNWRNYASEGLQQEWLHMSGRQRLIIAAMLEEIADKEEWE